MAEINRRLVESVLEQTTTQAGEPIVLDRGNDVSLRSCVDYHRLSAITVRDSYSLKRLDECIVKLREVTVLSTLGTNSEYKKSKIYKRGGDKKNFTSQYGLRRLK